MLTFVSVKIRQLPRDTDVGGLVVDQFVTSGGPQDRQVSLVLLVSLVVIPDWPRDELPAAYSS